MKVYFINLDRSPDRLSWFRSQGAALGLDLVRVPAVDARELERRERDRLLALSSGNSELSDAEIACFLSHREAWRILVAGGEEWAFVAEDDVHFSADVSEFLKAADWIPDGVELIKAETNLRRQELSQRIWGRPFGHELRQLRSDHYCAGGYFLSRHGARRLLEFTERHCEPADVILFSPQLGILRHTPVLQITPAICLQDMYLAGPARKSMQSDIEDSRKRERRERKRRTSRTERLRREARRFALQIIDPFRRLFLVVVAQSKFSKIPFAGVAGPERR